MYYFFDFALSKNAKEEHECSDFTAITYVAVHSNKFFISIK